LRLEQDAFARMTKIVCLANTEESESVKEGKRWRADKQTTVQSSLDCFGELRMLCSMTVIVRSSQGQKWTWKGVQR
jgi:hypothetical protein